MNTLAELVALIRVTFTVISQHQVLGNVVYNGLQKCKLEAFMEIYTSFPNGVYSVCKLESL